MIDSDMRIGLAKLVPCSWCERSGRQDSRSFARVQLRGAADSTQMWMRTANNVLLFSTCGSYYAVLKNDFGGIRGR